MLRSEAFFVFLFKAVLELPGISNGGSGENQSEAKTNDDDPQKTASKLPRHFFNASLGFLQVVAIQRAKFFGNCQDLRVLLEHGATQNGAISPLFFLRIQCENGTNRRPVTFHFHGETLKWLPSPRGQRLNACFHSCCSLSLNRLKLSSERLPCVGI